MISPPMKVVFLWGYMVRGKLNNHDYCPASFRKTIGKIDLENSGWSSQLMLVYERSFKEQ